ncbi:MAG: hypothetical protein ACLRP3_17755 [Escherichia sp.]
MRRLSKSRSDLSGGSALSPIVEEADDTERDQLQAIFDAVDELSQESLATF